MLTIVRLHMNYDANGSLLSTSRAHTSILTMKSGAKERKKVLLSSTGIWKIGT